MNVFLSASFPDDARGDYKPHDPAAIYAAVRAITRAVLLAPDGRLVFGAHPTISPVVLLVAGEFGVKGRIDVFQSRYFEGQFPEETQRLVDLGYGELIPTDADPSGELAPSLEIMRREMLTRRPLAAGVFIGGMEGIRGEYELLAELQPDAARLVLKAPGGMARRLEPATDPIARELEDVLATEHYPVVARRIVDALDPVEGDDH
jgi:hypothetical protein